MIALIPPLLTIKSMSTLYSSIFRHRPNRTVIRRFYYLIIPLSAAIVVGCTSLQQANTADSPTGSQNISADLLISEITADDAMISDLISAIVQILPPTSTTVQASIIPTSRVHKLVVQAMAQRGYGMRMVTADQGSMLVTTEYETRLTENNKSNSTIRIGIGPMFISRSYALTSDDVVQPISPFRLYGTRSAIDVASTYFGARTASQEPVSATEYAAPDPLRERLPALSLITPELVQRIAGSTPGSLDLTSLNSSQVEVNNLFFSDSTFGSILDGHEQIEELIVIFPNDSIVMGNENRQLVQMFAEHFVEDHDLISVVGCSNGPTSSELGNAGLALGRGERVTDELITVGVPREKVLDEGCWAPIGGVKSLPSRGVVLSLWREMK